MPEASIATITSAEHGAQHECSSALFLPSGQANLPRLKSSCKVARSAAATVVSLVSDVFMEKFT